ncbi:uncharacterized protein VTP21DRAFT_6342 [Calcarisporiella thermophila]|uniref:uncharacterized protein n=1 Tax=Calcarisporiella thermophila TaxID=911321 RepID=UPI003743942C
MIGDDDTPSRPPGRLLMPMPNKAETSSNCSTRWDRAWGKQCTAQHYTANPKLHASHLIRCSSCSLGEFALLMCPETHLSLPKPYSWFMAEHRGSAKFKVKIACLVDEEEGT